jgi:L-lysine exporter family protein LysE/ArgO
MNAATLTTGFALSAGMIIAIGAQNAFVLRQGLRREHIAAIVVFCIAADVLLISAGVAGLAEVLRNAPLLATVLTVGGVLFLSWYGVSALRRAFRSNALHAATGNTPMSLRVALAQAAGVTLLNPHVYLDTVLLLGSIGARQPPDLRMWFVGGAALASSTWFTALGFGARLLAPFFERPRAWRILDIVVGLTMLTLAAILLTQTGF